MKEAELQALREWANGAPRSGMHIDEVLPGLDRTQWLAATLVAFEELCSSCKANMLILACFPLECSSILDTQPAKWSEVVDMRSDEPPSLHIVSPEMVLLDECEEYRYPLDEPSLGERSVYYRCFRPRMGIENAWEYERAVYVGALALP